MRNSPPRPLDAPPVLLAGKVHGLRRWRVTAEHGRLRLYGHGRTRWCGGGRATKAHCLHGGPGRCKRPPGERCPCGLYALHPDLHHADWHAEPITRARNRSAGAIAPEVVGVVEAWGLVRLHRGGLRAEYARPDALAPLGGDAAYRALVARLAAAHGCELIEARTSQRLSGVCAERGWGLDGAVVEDLLAPPDR